MAQRQAGFAHLPTASGTPGANRWAYWEEEILSLALRQSLAIVAPADGAVALALRGYSQRFVLYAPAHGKVLAPRRWPAPAPLTGQAHPAQCPARGKLP